MVSDKSVPLPVNGLKIFSIIFILVAITALVINQNNFFVVS